MRPWKCGGKGEGGEGCIAAIQTNLKGGQEGKIGGTGGRRLKMGRGGAARSARLEKGDRLSCSCGQAGRGRGEISGHCRFGPSSPCPNLEPVALFKRSSVALGHGTARRGILSLVSSLPLVYTFCIRRGATKPSGAATEPLASSIALLLPTQHKFVLPLSL